jgi:transcriptional regulator of acetoin/glycerol metabolism
MTPSFAEHIVRRIYAANARELDAILWRSMRDSPEDTLVVPESEAGQRPSAREPVSPEPTGMAEPTADAIRAALTEAKGSVTRAAKALGLSSRYALYRLMKKHGVEGQGETE